MVPLHALWLPIVVSAVIVFILSSLLHMVLPIHRNDFKVLPSEDKVMDALRAFNIPPGDYMMPCTQNPKEMRSPEFKAKFAKGPVAIMTIMKGGTMNILPNLAKWFGYLLVVGVFAAYVSGRALGHDASYLQVFRFVGVTAFLGYVAAMWQDWIWYQRSLATTLRYTFDGLLFALMTAGTFGWLWPR